MWVHLCVWVSSLSHWGERREKWMHIWRAEPTTAITLTCSIQAACKRVISQVCSISYRHSGWLRNSVISVGFIESQPTWVGQ